MRIVNKKEGFTLIELSLSLVFIAILSLTIAYIINDTVASYRRGITLNQINTVGMDLVDDMRAAIQGSSTKSIVDDCGIIYGNIGGEQYRKKCEENGAGRFVFAIRTGDVGFRDGEKMTNVPLYGIFCTGTYSYLWNSGYYFNNEKIDVNGISPRLLAIKFNSRKDDEGSVNPETKSDFRLLKIRDESRAVCTSVAGTNYSGTLAGLSGSLIDITGTTEVVTEEPIDLLKSDEVSNSGGLAIYDLYTTTPAVSTAKNTMFYSVSFVLGTIQGGINVTKAGNFCATPDDYDNENFDYCAINKFNFAAQATGG